MNTPVPQKAAHANQLPSIGTGAETVREDLLGPACSIGQAVDASRERSAYRVAAARFVAAVGPSAQTRRHVMSARADWVRRKTIALFPSY
jgi:hypothetical protein